MIPPLNFYAYELESSISGKKFYISKIPGSINGLFTASGKLKKNDSKNSQRTLLCDGPSYKYVDNTLDQCSNEIVIRKENIVHLKSKNNDQTICFNGHNDKFQVNSKNKKTLLISHERK